LDTLRIYNNTFDWIHYVHITPPVIGY
jgi:hypothetical protein